MFEDYSDVELRQILRLECKKNKVDIRYAVESIAVASLSKARSKPNFGNAGAVKNMLGQALVNMGERRKATNDSTYELLAADFAFCAPKNADSPFAELDQMYKVTHIKKRLEDSLKRIQIARRDGMSVEKLQAKNVKNYLFCGNPGTGKTTVARLMADMLYATGIIASDMIVETSGLDMTGSYTGQTKDKVRKLMDEARGGVLFIGHQE